ncbi:serine carboxypeptidase S28-domain-containing protein [Lentinula aciculospora]|uniref:Serine carboxypeptidase S28-domain-containing protein n=1 Tax=Lentinula aciculospora TaxID=153920 RepID=A0A9W9AGH2_9AGAR|nr:serine carboxypeptidase S28-domain-containing protein [Lentinula aciculospora]
MKIIGHVHAALLGLGLSSSSNAIPTTELTDNTNQSSLTPRFFTQKLDHSSNTSDVFQQQYQLDTTFFEPGGPILFFLGEEATEMIRIETTILYSWAQELGDIATAIEHRYFGKSLPFGNDSWTRDNIQYLTLDNVMADGVEFVNSIKANVTGAEHSPPKGSYGGFLTAMFRLNHPETFFGGVASAGPSTMIKCGPFRQVSNVHSDRSAEEAAKIKEGLLALEQRFQTDDNVAGLQQELGLCSAPTNSSAECRVLTQFLANTFSFGAEFNYAAAQPGRSLVTPPPELIVNATIAQSDPIQVLNVTQWIWYEPLGYTCLDILNGTSKNGIQGGVPLIQSVPFSYITCTYLPIESTDISNDTIFFTLPSGEELEAKYHFTPEKVSSSERIIFSVGQYDPTTSLAPMLLPSGSRNVSKTLYVSGMAHREDLFAPSDSDSLTVTQARDIELQTIKKWINAD